jgi:phage-related protein
MTIDGKSSKDFCMYISGGGTYLSPEKKYDTVDIPGRNGTLFLYTDAYNNVEVTYEAFIAKNEGEREVDVNLRNLRSFLLSRNGYFRIEDTYHPDEYRIGVYNQAIEPEMLDSLEAAQFTLTFSCKPQRFLKKYDQFPVVISTSGTVFNNETYFIAKPLIRAYGTGWFQIGSKRITINSANSYTDIDCELQEAYKDTLATNCNGNITLTNSEFPYLSPGDNTITFSGITTLEMYPRMFML